MLVQWPPKTTVLGAALCFLFIAREIAWGRVSIPTVIYWSIAAHTSACDSFNYKWNGPFSIDDYNNYNNSVLFLFILLPVLLLCRSEAYLFNIAPHVRSISTSQLELLLDLRAASL